jgi:hypothetical protein
MLKLDNAQQEAIVPAVRPGNFVADDRSVTPAELAEALAALKGTTHRETLDLDVALHRMNVSVSSEHVRAEIESARKAHGGVQTAPPKERTGRAGFITLGLFTVFLALIAFAWLGTLANPEGTKGVWYALARLLRGNAVPPQTYIPYNPLLIRTATSKPLSEVKDGEMVYVSPMQDNALQHIESQIPAAIAKVLKAGALVETVEPKNAKQRGQTARYVRYGKHWYHCAWTTRTPIQVTDPKTGQRVEYFAFSDTPAPYVLVTQIIPHVIPPDASPKQVNELLVARPKYVPVSIGPVNQRVLIPVSSEYEPPVTKYLNVAPHFTLVAASKLDSRAWSGW